MKKIRGPYDGCQHKMKTTEVSPNRWSHDCPKCGKHLMDSGAGVSRGTRIIFSEQNEVQ